MIKTDMEPKTSRAITARSMVFGLLGVFLMAGLAGYHDTRCDRPLMVGNHMPGGAFTYLMFVGIVWNGLVGRFRRSWALNSKELAVVLVMTLVACFPPTSGLGRYFHRVIMLPWYYLPGKPDWIRHQVLERLNPALFPSPAPFRDATTGLLVLDERVYRGFFTGLAQGTQGVPLLELPLRAWMGSLAYWGPLIFLMSLCTIALQFLVHQQWAHHEQLSYPVAQVASSFCIREDGRRGVPDVFRNRLFWWGLVPVLALYTLEFLSQWYPLTIPNPSVLLPNLKTWQVPLVEKIPILKRTTEGGTLSGQPLLFTIVGLAYFVSSEISLTMGLASFLLAILGVGYYYAVGTPMTGAELEVGRAGAYFGYSLILLYTGRTYFQAVLRRAFLNRGSFDADSPAVLAARILVLAFIGFVAVLRLMGCDLLMAFFFSLILLMLFFVLTRVICETGIPFMQAGWLPGQLMVSLFGPAAIGPASVPLLLWLNTILVQDPRECLMPYVATSVKVADDNGIKLKRVFLVIVIAVALALVVSFLSSSYTQYNFSSMSDGWASRAVPQRSFDQAARIFGDLQETNELERSGATVGLAKLGLLRANPVDLRFFVSGAGLVLLFVLLRFRFSKFPVHPVLFIVWGSFPSKFSWGSFMAGWFVKMLVVRFGGGGVYQRLKPLFIGIISGELLAVGLHIIVNLLYLWVNGEPSGITINILPG